MTKKVYSDKAGNSLVKNFDGSYSVENAKGNRVSGSEVDKFLKRNPKAKNGFWD